MKTTSHVIDIVFADADAAHRAHLATQSYAQHVALGDFYEEAREKVDKLVENMIALDLPAPEPDEANMLTHLESRYVELAGGRDELCQGATVLENIFDELLQVYTRAIYKLKRFTKI